MNKSAGLIYPCLWTKHMCQPVGQCHHWNHHCDSRVFPPDSATSSASTESLQCLNNYYPVALIPILMKCHPSLSGPKPVRIRPPPQSSHTLKITTPTCWISAQHSTQSPLGYTPQRQNNWLNVSKTKEPRIVNFREKEAKTQTPV